ncbi:MAG: hypothetical protein JWO05_3683 [Gemmatimonadetes bacterium]|nr:hypothetical protein [Gemmatimonadota bacterium]
MPAARSVATSKVLPHGNEERPAAAIATEVPEYAGHYIDKQGRLVILVADTTKGPVALGALNRRVSAGAIDPATTRGRTTIYRHSKYTFGELADYRDRVLARLEVLPDVNSIDLAEADNVVRVGVNEAHFGSANSSVKQVLLAAGIPANALDITSNPGYQLTDAPDVR